LVVEVWIRLWINSVLIYIQIESKDGDGFW